MLHVILSTAISLLAVTPAAQPATTQSTIPSDANSAMLASDLRTVSRIAGVSDNLNDSRQVLLAVIDSDVQTLRMPREDGTYQWASLQRVEGGRVQDEKTVEYVYTEKELRYVTVTAPNGYRVEISVPKKRGTFSANNRVWVRNVIVDSTGFDGKTSHQEIPVNAWVNPGDAAGVPLPDIGKSVKATAELGVESGNKAAIADVALLQAKLVDDPNSPYYPAVTRLLQLRETTAAKDIDRGRLKMMADEALLALPGELDRRTAEQARAAEERRQMVAAGTTKGTIAAGDATTDVLNEMREIARLMNGTLQEQTDGRARLQALVDSLTPKMP